MKHTHRSIEEIFFLLYGKQSGRKLINSDPSLRSVFRMNAAIYDEVARLKKVNALLIAANDALRQLSLFPSPIQ